ncbi:MAG: hypothetical protein JNK57_05015 [Planctomycetaceae bacterium]|nr:hypothetical protein [Planctomycetaceae bacterium]
MLLHFGQQLGGASTIGVLAFRLRASLRLTIAGALGFAASVAFVLALTVVLVWMFSMVRSIYGVWGELTFAVFGFWGWRFAAGRNVQLDSLHRCAPFGSRR